MKYEIDRRYPFKATVDSVCPVPDWTRVSTWWSRNAGDTSCEWAQYLRWNRPENHSKNITHFMVLEYPPEKHTAWVNIRSEQHATLHETREASDLCGHGARIACIKIEWTEGEGL